MPNKSKLSTDEKVEIVEAYMSGQLGRTQFMHEYGMPSMTLYKWVRLYQTRGVTGLIPPVKNKKYSLELKYKVIKEYLAGNISFINLCKKYDITDTHIVRKWIKKYNDHKEFRSPNSGERSVYMANGKETSMEERIEAVQYCLKMGKDYGKVIEIYGVSYQQIYNWTRKYETNGVGGLEDRRGQRKPESKMTEIEKLKTENKLLQAKLERVEMENYLLKKLDEIERRRG